MYQADGIDLASDEFIELSAVIAAEEAGDLDGYVHRVLYRGQRLHLVPDERVADALLRLRAKGLLDVEGDGGALGVLRGPSQLGRSWLVDYYAEKRDKAAETRSQRLHEYRVAAVSAATGLVAGLVLEYATNLLHLILP